MDMLVVVDDEDDEEDEGNEVEEVEEVDGGDDGGTRLLEGGGDGVPANDEGLESVCVCV